MANYRVAPSLASLQDLRDPPKRLYYQGKWNESLFVKCVAVVGSRRITEYGRRVIEKLVPQLVQNGWTIVSGFMYGVDQEAHRACLECGGKTIAVLGWGINWPLADGDLQLAQLIIKNGGLVLSEWEDQQPTLWTFPLRNRIVAAISQEVIVVEAAARSGALITTEIAAKLGRKIWAVPGPITSKISEGTNRLIASGKAQMWLPQSQLNLPILPDTDNPILGMLENEALNASEIARKLSQPVGQVGAQLSILVLSGGIIERDGKYFTP